MSVHNKLKKQFFRLAHILYQRQRFCLRCIGMVCVFLASSSAAAVHEDIKLTASDPAEHSRYGDQVSLDGNRLIIANENDGDNAGAVYVYELAAGEWFETAKIKASDNGSAQYFGRGGVQLDGDRFIVSSPNAEAVYVYDLVGDVWVESKLEVQGSDTFGTSAWLDGNRLVVGAFLDPGNGPSFGSGLAYIFELNDGLWTQTAELVASDGNDFDGFGYSVSLDGDRVIVGAFRDSDIDGEAGSAYVFELSDGAWLETAKLIPNDPNYLDNFGTSVSLEGGRAVISAPNSYSATSLSGSVYIFEESNGSWTQTAKLNAHDGAKADYFGGSISLEADKVLVGASRNDDTAIATGAAYLFEFDGNHWSETAKITASDAGFYTSFGRSVSMHEGRAIVGASNSAYYFSEIDGCSYDGAALNGGWGWNQSTQLSCMPVVEESSCDYSNASLQGGWGWDPIASLSCPPLMDEYENITCIDTDGDGWGWQQLNSQEGRSCVMR